MSQSCSVVKNITDGQRDSERHGQDVSRAADVDCETTTVYPVFYIQANICTLLAQKAANQNFQQSLSGFLRINSH